MNNCVSSAFRNASNGLRRRDQRCWLREKVFHCEYWVTRNVNCDNRWFNILWFLPLFAKRDMFHECLINLLFGRVIRNLILQVSNYEFQLSWERNAWRFRESRNPHTMCSLFGLLTVINSRGFLTTIPGNLHDDHTPTEALEKKEVGEKKNLKIIKDRIIHIYSFFHNLMANHLSSPCCGIICCLFPL